MKMSVIVTVHDRDFKQLIINSAIMKRDIMSLIALIIFDIGRFTDDVIMSMQR